MYSDHVTALTPLPTQATQRQIDVAEIAAALRDLRARVRPGEGVHALTLRRDAPAVAVVRAWTELSSVLDATHPRFSDLLHELALLEYDALLADRRMDGFWDRMSDL